MSLDRRFILFIIFIPLSGICADWTVQTREPTFQFSKWRTSFIRPLTSVSKPWRLCTVYPHIKDSYWLSVNYGMVDQAKKLGINLRVAEAGGYHRMEHQWQQVKDCLVWKPHALLLGTVAYSEIIDRLKAAGSSVPLFGLVNDLSKEGLVGRVGVSWYQMGYKVGAFLAEQHPKGSSPVTVAWFPGPAKLEIKSKVGQGIKAALKSSSVDEFITAGDGDNDRNIQRTLLQELLDKSLDIDYIIGGAVLAEVAINELKKRQLKKTPKILSHYYSHGMYRALLRNKVLMVNTDQMVLNGRLAIDQAVRYLEKQPFERDIGPSIISLTQDNLDDEINRHSLSPAGFIPTYLVQPSGSDYQ